jgi:hypothetical protein
MPTGSSRNVPLAHPSATSLTIWRVAFGMRPCSGEPPAKERRKNVSLGRTVFKKNWLVRAVGSCTCGLDSTSRAVIGFVRVLDGPQGFDSSSRSCVWIARAWPSLEGPRVQNRGSQGSCDRASGASPFGGGGQRGAKQIIPPRRLRPLIVNL